MARVCALAALFAAAAAQDAAGPPPGCGGNAPLQGQSGCDDCDGLVFIAAHSICTRCTQEGAPLTEAMVGMIAAEDGAQICGELSTGGQGFGPGGNQGGGNQGGNPGGGVRLTSSWLLSSSF